MTTPLYSNTSNAKNMKNLFNVTDDYDFNEIKNSRGATNSSHFSMTIPYGHCL
jgi:hypothetical protein